MLFYRNTFPEFLEAISIGPDPSFLEKNTDFCDFATSFPEEVELMYDWKSVKRSSNPMNALRNFTKKFIIYGPNLDVQTIKFFVQKVNNFPADYSDRIKEEVINAFEKVKNINTRDREIITTTTKTVTGNGTTGYTKISSTDYNYNSNNNNSGGGGGGTGTSGGEGGGGGGGGGGKIPGGGSIIPNNTPIKGSFITNNTTLGDDKNFLDKLADMMRGCNAPCNYFKPTSSSMGTLADFGRALSDAASVLAHAGDDALHAPINIATNIYNKVKPQVRGEFLKLKVLTQDLYRDGVKPFFSKEDRARVASQTNQGYTPDQSARLPLTGDTSAYFTVSNIHSQIQAKIKEQLGDCYRMHANASRFNAYDSVMNAAYSKRKYIGVKNGNVKSLVDILGSLAPAQYAAETTYQNALDMPKKTPEPVTVPKSGEEGETTGTPPPPPPTEKVSGGIIAKQNQDFSKKPDYYKHDDAPKAKKYDKYDGPSAGAEAVVTAGGSTTINAAAAGATTTAGAGLENIPNTGRVYEFGFGEVKVTAYGYIMDECPDSGSEIGLGNNCNLLQSLKTVAINPENIGKDKMFKLNDVLLITCEDRNGNRWEERRIAGDASGNSIAGKGTPYKLLIDEFLPTKSGSKLYAAANTEPIGKNLKLTIRVADTKQNKVLWNPAEASISSPMFLNRNDWERVKAQSKPQNCAFVKAKMDTEYIKFVKWSPDEKLEPKFIAFFGCRKGGCNKWRSC